MRAQADQFDWTTFHETFEDTAWVLPPEAKSRVWELAAHNHWRPTVFRALAGPDAGWIESLLTSRSIDAEFVLDTVTGIGVSPSLEDLARLLIPRGSDPTRIGSRIQYGTGFGEKHERIEGYLEVMDRLCESAEPALRSVGAAGRTYFTPMHERAIREARQKEVRGEL